MVSVAPMVPLATHQTFREHMSRFSLYDRKGNLQKTFAAFPKEQPDAIIHGRRLYVRWVGDDYREASVISTKIVEGHDAAH